MIMALLRAKLEADKPANRAGGKPQSAAGDETSDLQVSASLLKTLKNPKFR